MHRTFCNCNDAFRQLVFGIKTGTILTRRTTSRVGDVLQIEEPVTITYTHPRERVLFNQARDCNPFFHLYESLWMLAGRQDIEPLAYYAANYREQVQDGDNPNANGAYGYRWRHAEVPCVDAYHVEDQLKIIIDHLRRKPESRRVVLQMWAVGEDLLKIDTSKDVCCNVCAFFSIRRWDEPTGDWDGSLPTNERKALDMTVINRSNDLVWGALGANVVHFSFLQEYLACCLGVEVGVYNQISNNLHVYVNNWKPVDWMADSTPDYYADPQAQSHYEWGKSFAPKWPLVRDQETFDREVVAFVDSSYGDNFKIGNWEEPFLQTVAGPMMWAFFNHKRRDYQAALSAMDLVQAADWQVAGRNWLLKRQRNWETKNANRPDGVGATAADAADQAV